LGQKYPQIPKNLSCSREVFFFVMYNALEELPNPSCQTLKSL
jgi:hypothetical protein